LCPTPVTCFLTPDLRRALHGISERPHRIRVLYHPRISHQLNFFSWLVFTFVALRLGLYAYGDLFVVRWKQGSFPAAFKNIITTVVLVIVALILLKAILDINVTSLIATTTVLTATIGLAFQSTLANMLAV
jgi:small-conductance mechanosensitive channel